MVPALRPLFGGKVGDGMLFPAMPVLEAGGAAGGSGAPGKVGDTGGAMMPVLSESPESRIGF